MLQMKLIQNQSQCIYQKKNRYYLQNLLKEINQIKKSNNNNKINLNHHWKKYYDSKYNQIFYNNPFTGESVWELPKGAIVEESNEPIEIIQSNESNKEKEKSNSDNDSITEEYIPNSYKEIEAIEETELK